MKTLTRLHLNLAVVFYPFLQFATAQNIPDPNFADAIRDVCPACIDINNNLTPAAQNLDSLDVSYSGISNLAGIEGFTSLQILDCSNSDLTIQVSDLPEGIYWLEERRVGWVFGEKILKK